MSNSATSTDLSAENADEQTAGQQLGGADSTLSDYLSNVNSQLSSGNPYESQAYQEQQNLDTSGAMNSEKDAADQALSSTVARTGTNSAALASTEANNARQGQQQETQYTAGQNAENAHDWQNEEQQLDSDQLAGAGEYGSLAGMEQGAANSALGDYTTADDEEDQMWAGLAGSALGGAGLGAGIAMK